MRGILLILTVIPLVGAAQMRLNLVRSALVATVAAWLVAAPLGAQDNAAALEAGRRVASLRAEPTSMTIERGKSVALKVTALDASGQPVPNALIRYAAPFRTLRVAPDGQVTGVSPGAYEIVATVAVPPNSGVTPPSVTIAVDVVWPKVAKVTVSTETGRLYVGTTLAHGVSASHADGSPRPAAEVNWRSSNPAVATVDRFGYVSAHAPGDVVITAGIEGVTGEIRHRVAAFPGSTIEATLSKPAAITGEVVHLSATVRGRDGRPVTDVPVTWSYTYMPDDSVRAPGAVGIIDEGKFAAESPGVFTLLATAGQLTARATLDVRPRDAIRLIQAMGQGSITHVHTSDLWPFEGMNGRDYAVVGTWGGDGWAYMYDITDPSNLFKTDSVRVDARTINDVTVAPNGRWAALSREGASNRVNGVVILDLADPAHPVVAATFDQQLTGGVHNMFATNTHLFAISGGDKYVIIDMADIRNPKYVSEYNHPESSVHDVWVHDGIAYSSEWGTGVVAVDVGNGKYGGTLQQPKLINTYATSSGRTHEVYPYFPEGTGKVYLFLGDEIMTRRGKAWAGTTRPLNEKGGVPLTMAGYTHIVDFTDPLNPKSVARYENPEFGTHDIIVEDGILYQAYYDGGLRVVDVSGELLGNLARQHREIAVYKPYAPDGFIANSPMVMNANPWKGHIFFTDFNSGLWAAKLLPKNAPVP